MMEITVTFIRSNISNVRFILVKKYGLKIVKSEVYGHQKSLRPETVGVQISYLLPAKKRLICLLGCRLLFTTKHYIYIQNVHVCKYVI
jgi:hypothetical protein